MADPEADPEADTPDMEVEAEIVADTPDMKEEAQIAVAVTEAEAIVMPIVEVTVAVGIAADTMGVDEVVTTDTVLQEHHTGAEGQAGRTSATTSCVDAASVTTASSRTMALRP
mmetsp:Transcript_37449/g.81528  ORF Transcript_37449/g.81528 Transcript_37449/m.81528 type:complete len:113 (+) Transcript_37449:206-544(+)